MKKLFAASVMLVLSLLFGFGSCFAGYSASFIDVAINEKSQAIAIFRSIDGEDGEVMKIRLDYVNKKNELDISDFIEPSYVGLHTKTFILPDKIVSEHRFNINVHTSTGKSKYVLDEMQTLK